MIFKDPKLQEHCDRVIAVMTSLPDDQREVCALMDAHYWFGLVEGKDSPRSQEALELLIAIERRPALKSWYSRFPSLDRPNEVFRQLLEKATGEQLPLGKS